MGWLDTRIPRDNNFTLIRLFAALQVVAMHADTHLRVGLPGRGLLEMFHGVPIFFFISGMLVTLSLGSRNLGSYIEARMRRIFPALWLAFLFAAVLLISFGQIGLSELTLTQFWLWAFGQITVFQVYHPDIFRDFGVGAVNGSLWTIPVELGFYIALPILALVARKKAVFHALVIVGAVVSFAIYQWAVGRDGLGGKILMATPLAHFWLFAMGVLAFLHFDKALAWASQLNRYRLGYLYPLAAYVAAHLLPLPEWLTMAISAPLMAATIFCLAFTAPKLKEPEFDISYGVYLFHMLVVNAFVALGHSGWTAALATLAITLGLAWLSWTYVERPVLRPGERKPVAVKVPQ